MGIKEEARERESNNGIALVLINSQLAEVTRILPILKFCSS